MTCRALAAKRDGRFFGRLWRLRSLEFGRVESLAGLFVGDFCDVIDGARNGFGFFAEKFADLFLNGVEWEHG